MSTPLTREQKITHLLNRISFGPTREEAQRVDRLGFRAYLDEQLEPDKIADPYVEEKLAGLKTMRLSSRELIELYPLPRQAQQQAKQQQAQQQMSMLPMEMQGPRQVILELQLARLLRAIYSRRQLYEIVVDFWSNHFNIFAGKGADRWLTTAYDRDTIRPNALGRFGALLRATAESPAMLFYLDNWLSTGPDSPASRQAIANNRRRGLNENYARELMELHTLGVDGGYTQKDIQEVARCLTGWTIREPQKQAEFVFNARMHDDGEKFVLGTRIAEGGVNEGLKVLDLLVRHPSTAKFIASKLARRFVADDPPASIVNRATETFRETDGDLRAVLRTIIDSPEFFSEESYRAKVKKPVEFVASALRATGAETKVTHQLVRYLARMGEPLYLAQPPTGFPDRAASWVSPDMLLTRMNFASDLVSNRLEGSRVRPELLSDSAALVRLIAPDSLAPATRAALAESEGKDAVALLMAAPEFQRR